MDAPKILTLDDHIAFFEGVKNWAEGNGHGNSHAVLVRIVRDLKSLSSLPAEAFVPATKPEVDSEPEADVNSELDPPVDP